MNIIMTCGTSIINNGIRALSLGNDRNIDSLEETILNNLAYKSLTDREYGAEINALVNIKDKKNLNIESMYLIVSDTDQGRMSGSLIKGILECNSLCKSVNLVEIEDLNSKKEHVFAKRGLKNLTHKVTDIISANNFYTENLMILPLGGFKAEISLVGLIAQIFGIRTYYMFESFNEVIELMPMPISFDKSVFINNSEFFIALNHEEIIDKSKLESYISREPKLKNLIEEIREGKGNQKRKYIALSAIGQAFYDKLSMETKNGLPSPTDKSVEEKESIHLFKGNEEHARMVYNTSAFKSFLKKIHEIEYIEKVIINGSSQSNRGDQVFLTKSANKQGERVIHCKFNTTKGASGMLEMDIYLTENEDEKVECALIDSKERLIKEGIKIAY